MFYNLEFIKSLKQNNQTNDTKKTKIEYVFVAKMNWNLRFQDVVKIISYILSCGFVIFSNFFTFGFHTLTEKENSAYMVFPLTFLLLANGSLFSCVLINIFATRCDVKTYTSFQVCGVLMVYGMFLCICQIIGMLILSKVNHKMYGFNITSFSTGLYFSLIVISIIGIIILTIYLIKKVMRRYQLPSEETRLIETTSINPTEIEIIIEE